MNPRTPAILICAFYLLTLPFSGYLAYKLVTNTELVVETPKDSLVHKSMAIAKEYMDDQLMHKPLYLLVQAKIEGDCVVCGGADSPMELFEQEFYQFTQVEPVNNSKTRNCFGQLQAFYLLPPIDAIRGKFIGGLNNDSTLMILDIKGNEDDCTHIIDVWASEHTPSQFKTALTSVHLIIGDLEEGILTDIAKIDAITMPLAFAALAYCLKSVRLLLLPLLSLPVILLSTFAIMYPVSLVLIVTPFAPEMASAVTASVTIDYSLFLLARFREELNLHCIRHDTPSPDLISVEMQWRIVKQTTMMSAHNIAVSGLTIAAALGSLAFLPVEFLSSIGIMFAVGAVCAVCVSLTLMPSLLLIFFKFFADRQDFNKIAKMGRMFHPKRIRRTVRKVGEKTIRAFSPVKQQPSSMRSPSPAGSVGSHGTDGTGGAGFDGAASFASTRKSGHGGAAAPRSNELDAVDDQEMSSMHNLIDTKPPASSTSTPPPQQQQQQHQSLRSADDIDKDELQERLVSDSPTPSDYTTTTVAAPAANGHIGGTDSVFTRSPHSSSEDESEDEVEKTLEVLRQEERERQNKSIWFKIGKLVCTHPFKFVVVITLLGTPFFYLATEMRVDFNIFHEVPRDSVHTATLKTIMSDIGRGSTTPFYLLVKAEEEGGLKTTEFFETTNNLIKDVIRATDQPPDRMTGFSFIPLSPPDENGRESSPISKDQAYLLANLTVIEHYWDGCAISTGNSDYFLHPEKYWPDGHFSPSAYNLYVNKSMQVLQCVESKTGGINGTKRNSGSGSGDDDDTFGGRIIFLSYHIAEFLLNSNYAFQLMWSGFVDKTDTVGLIALFPPFDPFSYRASEYLDSLSDAIDHFNRDDNPDRKCKITIGLLGSSTPSWEVMRQVMKVFPFQIGFTFLVIFVFLAIVFRSVFVPFRMVVTVAYTVAVTFGFGTLLFQYEWAHYAWKAMDGVVAYNWSVPVFCFSLFCSLALDYDVFLLTRIVEYKQRGYDDFAATSKAVWRTGRIISFAGVIMAIAFSSLMLSSSTLLNQFGVLTCFAVLCDTFIIRTYYVPALMSMFPAVAWWPRKFVPPTKGINDMDIDDELPDLMRERSSDIVGGAAGEDTPPTIQDV